MVIRLFWIAQKNGIAVSREFIAESVGLAPGLVVQVDGDLATGHRHVLRVVESTPAGHVGARSGRRVSGRGGYVDPGASRWGGER